MWILGVAECLLGFEVTRKLAPAWAWAWWVWLVVWVLAGVAVLISAVVRVVTGGKNMVRGGQPPSIRPLPAQPHKEG